MKYKSFLYIGIVTNEPTCISEIYEVVVILRILKVNNKTTHNRQSYGVAVNIKSISEIVKNRK